MQAQGRFSFDFSSVFPKVSQPFQAGLAAVRIRHDSLHHLEKILPSYAARDDVFRPGYRHPERSAVQHLRVDDHTSRLVVKQLDTVAPLVHEHVHVTVHRVAADLVPDQTAQRMEALPHVSRLAVEPVAQPAVQVKHGWTTL